MYLMNLTNTWLITLIGVSQFLSHVDIVRCNDREI